MQFWSDLQHEQEIWVTKGYKIVVGGAFNQYVGESSISIYFLQFGMREAILEFHG